MALVIGYTFTQAQEFVGIPKEKFDYVAASQHNGNWCWAATIQMVMNYYHIPMTQEEIVERTFGTNRYGELPDLPASHRLMTENLNTTLEDQNGKLKNVTAELHFGSPDAAYLIEKLKQQRPILISYNTGEDTEHAVIITGISYVQTRTGPEIETIYIRDPAPSEEKVQNLGRVEYDGEKFQNLITAYWEVDVQTGNYQQYANRNSNSNSTRTSTTTQYSQSTSTYNYKNTNGGGGSSSKPGASGGNTEVKRTTAASSSPVYSASR